jgi:hypothetical protein
MIVWEVLDINIDYEGKVSDVVRFKIYRPFPTRGLDIHLYDFVTNKTQHFYSHTEAVDDIKHVASNILIQERKNKIMGIIGND